MRGRELIMLVLGLLIVIAIDAIMFSVREWAKRNL